jgi:mevalonate kinase
MIKTSAPGKVILFGEHAVVYDKLGVAASVDRWSNVSFSDSKENIYFHNRALKFSRTMTKEQLFELLRKVQKLKEEKNFDGLKALHKSNKLNAPFFVIASVMDKYGFKPIELVTDGNVTKNLGSGSSAFAAIALAVSRFLGKNPSKKEIADFAYDGDVVAHGGTPSGIDSSAVAYGGYIKYRKSEGITPLRIDFEMPLIIVDSCEPAMTAETVPYIRKQHEENADFVDKVMERLNDISTQSLDALKERKLELMGELMLEYYLELKKLNISTKNLDRVIEIAIKNKALGAKPTGGWGGGCCIVLARDQKQAEELIRTYNDSGFNSFQTKIGVEGVKEIK